MAKALQKKFIDLINAHKNKERNEQREALISALEDAAVVAETLEVDHNHCAMNDYLSKLVTCLEGLENADKVEENYRQLEALAVENKFFITPETCSDNRWKAIGLLIIAALEFLVFAALLGALAALAGAVILGVGFGGAAWPFVGDVTVLQAVALIGALCGAVVGGVAGIIAAGQLTYASLQKLKTTEYVGFEGHDSLWELATQGKTKQVLIAERLLESYSLFKPQGIKGDDNTDNLDNKDALTIY